MEKCPNISFISQPGMSDLICSSEISVGDVLKKINTLMKVVKKMSDEPLESETPERAEDSYSNEAVLVHRAIGIVRRRMMKPKGRVENLLLRRNDIIESMNKFVDLLLCTAIGSLTNEEQFINADYFAEDDILQCLNSAHDSTALATSVMSPKHLGLAVHLHHEYGSQKLIEHMYFIVTAYHILNCSTFLLSQPCLSVQHKTLKEEHLFLCREFCHLKMQQCL